MEIINALDKINIWMKTNKNIEELLATSEWAERFQLIEKVFNKYEVK